jgi:hypothetical protein
LSVGKTMNISALRDIDNTTAFQIYGLAFSAIGGGLATFTETRSAKGKGLTWKGYLAISLIALGTALGGAGQALSNNDTQHQTTALLTNLNKTVNALDQVVTRIDGDISLTVNYELPQTNSLVSELRHYLNSEIGYTQSDSNSYEFILDKLLPEIATNASPDANRLLTTLSMPKFHIYWQPPQYTNSNDINLLDSDYLLHLQYLPSSNTNHVYLRYRPSNGEMVVEWNFDFPRDQWGRNGENVSIHDISQAHCYLRLEWSLAGSWTNDSDNRLDSLYDQMRPLSIDVRFGHYHSMTFNSFKPTKKKRYVEVDFPTESEILTGRASNDVEDVRL